MMDSVQVEVALGLLLRPLGRRIEREILAGLDAHLEALRNLGP